MHAILASLGTDGDIFPYVAVGARLRSRGHRVTLAASGEYEGLAAAHGFAFRPLISAAENHELLGNPDFWHPIKAGPVAARWAVRFIHRQYELLAQLAASGDAVLVANPGVLAASFVHEKLGTAWANLVLQPGIIPSSLAPPVMPGFAFPAWTPRWALKLFWRSLDGLGDLLVGRHVNRVRAVLGLKPMRRIFQRWLSPELVIGMFPDWYGPPQTDWPPPVRLTGFPMFDGGRQASVPSAVLEFCRAGSPPVVFTFGTGMMHAAAIFRAGLEACQILGARGIFLTKYPHQLPDRLPPFVLTCEFAPFQELFPHCAAVVHHGGIGTVAKALASGTPQLMLPIAFDQMDNATRVKKLAAGDWLRSKRTSGAQIAKALRTVMTAETRARCHAVAARFGKSDAVETAAQLVEALAAGSIGPRNHSSGASR